MQDRESLARPPQPDRHAAFAAHVFETAVALARTLTPQTGGSDEADDKASR